MRRSVRRSARKRTERDNATTSTGLLFLWERLVTMLFSAAWTVERLICALTGHDFVPLQTVSIDDRRYEEFVCQDCGATTVRPEGSPGSLI